MTFRMELDKPLDACRGGFSVSVGARHLELTETSPDHRVNDERGGDDLYRGAGQPTPLAAGRRFGGVHWPTQPTPALSAQTAC
jgi:hypothetical protein